MSSKIFQREKETTLKYFDQFFLNYMLIVHKIYITTQLTMIQSLIHPQQELKS